MGGLVGWIDFHRDLRTQEHVVRAMTETMRRRGPDDEGVYVSPNAALGHRRLAVVDPVGGRQPMRVDIGDASVVAVHVGEIYKAADLRRTLETEGARFRTRSDTEVLLQAYLRWGQACVPRLDGMFAFAVYDGRARRLLLGRDRIGLKPLYYYAYEGGILFASEPKGIMANPLFEARLDYACLPILLQPRLTMPGETPLLGLRELPPARTMTVTPEGASLSRYWRLESAPHAHSFEETVSRVRTLLEDSVERHLGADVPIGAMLSGGVDSTSVAALASRRLRGSDPDAALATYCIAFESDPDHFAPTELRPDIDAPYAEAAARFMGTRHTTVTATMGDLIDAIPETRRARDLPSFGQFDASMYLLFRAMRRDCTVVLTGEAADEIFGGYPYFFKPEVVAGRGFPWMGDGPKLVDHLAPDLAARIDPAADEQARYRALLDDVPRLEGEDPTEARMREIFHLGLAGPLSVILDRKDRMSSAVGAEVRVPFCDHRLLEYVWNVPWAMKSAGGVKGLLKAAMADVLPDATVNRKKSAYPHVQNPAYDHALVDEADAILRETGSPVAAMFDTVALGGMIEAIRGGAADFQGKSFPGGANAASMLIHFVETKRWIDDYGVSLR